MDLSQKDYLVIVQCDIVKDIWERGLPRQTDERFAHVPRIELRRVSAYIFAGETFTSHRLPDGIDQMALATLVQTNDTRDGCRQRNCHGRSPSSEGIRNVPRTATGGKGVVGRSHLSSIVEIE